MWYFWISEQFVLDQAMNWRSICWRWYGWPIYILSITFFFSNIYIYFAKINLMQNHFSLFVVIYANLVYLLGIYANSKFSNKKKREKAHLYYYRGRYYSFTLFPFIFLSARICYFNFFVVVLFVWLGTLMKWQCHYN